MHSKEELHDSQRVNTTDQADFIHTQAREILKHLPAMGPILMLYMQSAHRRHNFLADLEWLLLPPLMNKQCKLYMKQEYPVSFLSWAFLDKDAEKRLLSSGGRLRPGDWKCGDRLWIIDIVAPFGGVEEMLRDIRKNEFPDQTISLLAPDPTTGGIKARRIPARDGNINEAQKTGNSGDEDATIQ